MQLHQSSGTLTWHVTSVLAVLVEASEKCTNTTSDRRGMPLNHAQHWTQDDDPWQDVELATGIPDDGSQPQYGHNTRWIYPLLRRAGCIQPQKALESNSGAPPAPLSLVLPPKLIAHP
ncbi:hypothetical protein E8E15_010511 [Penicillium rubens]|nr:hypothetical protein E8E15_010511 [Penicillium rubens]